MANAVEGGIGRCVLSPSLKVDAADLLRQLTSSAAADDVNRPTIDRIVTKVGAAKRAIAAT
jgi:hypothetical protein